MTPDTHPSPKTNMHDEGIWTGSSPAAQKIIKKNKNKLANQRGVVREEERVKQNNTLNISNIQ